tara:strand:+ start:270 stop:539 length:270 start_codon:yes stop_codon:yes gene_type:complete
MSQIENASHIHKFVNYVTTARKSSLFINFLLLVLGILVINTAFLAIPFLSPRFSYMEILSYRIFANMLFILFIMLPKQVGNYKFSESDN